VGRSLFLEICEMLVRVSLAPIHFFALSHSYFDLFGVEELLVVFHSLMKNRGPS